MNWVFWCGIKKLLLGGGLERSVILKILFLFSVFFLFIGCNRQPTITAIAIHPSKPRIVYVAMKRGVFKSADYGKTWASRSEGLEDSQVRSLAIDPVLSSTVYAGTFAEAIFKSVDGGQRWRRANIGLKEHVSIVNSIALHPMDPNIIYLGSTVGVYKSQNAGKEWHETVKGMESVYVVSIVISRENPRLLYCGTSGGMYKSLDGGRIWLKINKGLIEGEVGTAMGLGVNAILLDPENQNRLIIGTNKGIFLSEDAGVTWKPSGSGLSKGAMFVATLLMDPNQNRILFAGTGKGIYKSQDGGKNWSLSANGLTSMVLWSMAMDPKDSNTIYAGTQGGLFRSTNGGQDWTLVNVLGPKEGEG